MSTRQKLFIARALYVARIGAIIIFSPVIFVAFSLWEGLHTIPDSIQDLKDAPSIIKEEWGYITRKFKP